MDSGFLGRSQIPSAHRQPLLRRCHGRQRQVWPGPSPPCRPAPRPLPAHRSPGREAGGAGGAAAARRADGESTGWRGSTPQHSTGIQARFNSYRSQGGQGDSGKAQPRPRKRSPSQTIAAPGSPKSRLAITHPIDWKASYFKTRNHPYATCIFATLTALPTASELPALPAVPTVRSVNALPIPPVVAVSHVGSES